MTRHITIIGIICLLVFSALSADAEKETELYIPIGQSPGLSGEYTVLGKIDQKSFVFQSQLMNVFDVGQDSTPDAD